MHRYEVSMTQLKPLMASYYLDLLIHWVFIVVILLISLKLKPLESQKLNNPRLMQAHAALEAWTHCMTSDPNKITSTWSGPNVCNYTGIYCAPAPDDSTIFTVAGIDLKNANISGSLPEDLGLLTDLDFFHINSNRFTGPLPENFTKLAYLYELDISFNQFSGPFPQVVLAIPSLRYLDIRFNNFAGDVPSSLFDLKLDALFINNNKFQFSLPQNFGNSPVSVMILSNNDIKGSIPSSVAKMKDTLNEIIISNTGLTGPLPQEIGYLDKVTVFDVSFNRLEGELPGTMQGMKSLEQLVLKHNNFSGVVPTSICMLPKLKHFDCSNNYFHGPFPKCPFIKRKHNPGKFMGF
ncbi:hypothetical protein S83_015727 [Arachis hypogaea]